MRYFNCQKIDKKQLWHGASHWNFGVFVVSEGVDVCAYAESRWSHLSGIPNEDWEVCLNSHVWYTVNFSCFHQPFRYRYGNFSTSMVSDSHTYSTVKLRGKKWGTSGTSWLSMITFFDDVLVSMEVATTDVAFVAQIWIVSGSNHIKFSMPQSNTWWIHVWEHGRDHMKKLILYVDGCIGTLHISSMRMPFF